VPANRQEPTDEELMLAAGRGSREAFAEIVDRHHARILNLLTFLTGDREMASDLTQDCFLRALRAAPRWKPRARLTTWLVTVARNAAFDAKRAAWQRREPLDVEPAAPGPAPDEVLSRHELAARLNAVLAELSPEDREALVLSELGGMSYREIARVAGVPEGTVASRKNRAVRRVRERWHRTPEEKS
jgi:RNA polymerase sigma-70 factor (ECF subfamily)